MSEDIDSPRPFRRERNLSNRNFKKRLSGSRRFSTESHSSTESANYIVESSTNTTTTTHATSSPIIHNRSGSSTPTYSAFNTSVNTSTSSTSSKQQYSYSVNSDTENAFNHRSVLKMIPASDEELDVQTKRESFEPALLDVKQKVERFETIRTIIGSALYRGRQNSASGNQNAARVQVLPMHHKLVEDSSTIAKKRLSIARSENDVDEFSDFEDEADGSEHATEKQNGEYILPEQAEELKEESLLERSENDVADEEENVHEYSIDDFGKVETMRRSTHSSDRSSTTSVRTLTPGGVQVVVDTPAEVTSTEQFLLTEKNANNCSKDFPRNYRSTPRPKTEIIGTSNRQLIHKFSSLYPRKQNAPAPPVEEDEPELRNKVIKSVQPILEELIKTEETYVDNLLLGIKNYGNIFQRKDLPIGLRGKKYVLFGNIEQLAEFHQNEFLPMLQRNQNNLKQLFDDFQAYIDQSCFYGYVIFTMNKKRSLDLCDTYKNYFKLIQSELDDKLGINSFLVQPIQRMARYPLLLNQFIKTLFDGSPHTKPVIKSLCLLEKKFTRLLITTNESEVINDIVDCHEFNVFYQGKFRKVSDFHVLDHTQKRSYRAKVFIFDKCIIYTEIKGKNLVFHGRYPCEHIGISAKTKSFTLYYERRKQLECDFTGDPQLIEMWLELIRDMISSYAAEERQKLQKIYSRDSDNQNRKLSSLVLFRDSNRFSADSGIGNIWVMPKPDIDDQDAGTRTTWYSGV